MHQCSPAYLRLCIACRSSIHWAANILLPATPRRMCVVWCVVCPAGAGKFVNTSIYPNADPTKDGPLVQSVLRAQEAAEAAQDAGKQGQKGGGLGAVLAAYTSVCINLAQVAPWRVEVGSRRVMQPCAWCRSQDGTLSDPSAANKPTYLQPLACRLSAVWPMVCVGCTIQ